MAQNEFTLSFKEKERYNRGREETGDGIWLGRMEGGGGGSGSGTGEELSRERAMIEKKKGKSPIRSRELEMVTSA